MVASLKNSLKILWPYTLCGVFSATIWFFDWRPYLSFSTPDLMKLMGLIYAVIVGNILYFAYQGIAQPQSKLHKILLSLVVFLTLFLSGLLAHKGWLIFKTQAFILSQAYGYWAGNLILIFALPALTSLILTFYAVTNLFSSAAKQVEEEPYGSARLSSAQEAMAKNDPTGLPLGRILSSVKGNDLNLGKKILSSKTGEIFKYNPVHSFLIAPTGAGKGVGFVVPTLLDYEGPVVTIDPKKAENFTITGRHRRQNGTRKVLAFDTCEFTGQETACLNIFDFLDIKHPKFVDTVKGFAASLCPTVDDEKLDYFKRASQNILTCLIIFVAKGPPEKRTLSTVFGMLMRSSEDLMEAFEEIYQDEELAEGVASRAAARVLSTEPRELSGCMNTARECLSFLDSPSYRHITSKTTIDLEDIFTNKADLFFCIPDDEIESHGHFFIRLVLSLIVHQLKRRDHPPKKNVLFLLDEMAAIGRIREVKNILLLGRSYGISLMGIAQSIEALKDIYKGEIKTILSSSLVMFLVVRETDDMSYISKRLGHKTVFSESNSTNEGDSKSKKSRTKSAIRREVLTTDEINDLGKNYVVAFLEEMKPIVFKRLTYFSDKTFQGKFDQNKFHG